MYTLSEFRKHLRQAFNDSEQGHEVVIERYGQKYQLVALVDGPLPHHMMESRPGKKPKAKGTTGQVIEAEGTLISVKPTSITNPTNPRWGSDVCKIHGTPLDARGKCLQKGCKYGL